MQNPTHNLGVKNGIVSGEPRVSLFRALSTDAGLCFLTETPRAHGESMKLGLHVSGFPQFPHPIRIKMFL
jgi:hypothetical protein